MKTAVITGGAKGIGAATAKVLSNANYKIVVLDIDATHGKRLSETIGASCLFLKCDVSKGEEVKEAIKKAIDFLGEIEVLVNSAGIQTYGIVTETTEESWDRVMNINLKSHFLCAKECLPSMQRNGSGVVISVSSVQAFASQDNVAAYTTSKTAILGLIRSIAIDYGPAIRALAICPGTVDTPMFREAIEQSPDPNEVLAECEAMHLSKRIAKPEEIAHLIHYCAGEHAGFITGQALRIDSGLGIKLGGSKRD